MTDITTTIPLYKSPQPINPPRLHLHLTPYLDVLKLAPAHGPGPPTASVFPGEKYNTPPPNPAGHTSVGPGPATAAIKKQ